MSSVDPPQLLDSGATQAPTATDQHVATPYTPILDLDWPALDDVLQEDTNNLITTNVDGGVANSRPAGIETFNPSSQPAWLFDALLIPQEQDQEISRSNTRSRSRSPSQAMLRSLGVRVPNAQAVVARSLRHEPSELISHYFKFIPRLYSTFDNHKNPYRSAVSNLFNHSLAVNLAAQSMAAACLTEAHPRFASVGMKLRKEALAAIENEPGNKFENLLALMMTGPTGNWFQAPDLGVSSYHAMRDRLDALTVSDPSNNSLLFFEESMVMWEMFLAYAGNPNDLRPNLRLPPAIQIYPSKREVHPWTGVARETMEAVRDIGRLVRGSRLRSASSRFISEANIRQMSAELATARHLERRLLACQHPDEHDIVDTEDAATPQWHITTMAELHRYAGLLQLYRVFPDVLSERLNSQESLTQLTDPSHCATASNRDEWLSSFAMEALRLLETIGPESGTKDFQPFLLVAFASELLCETSRHGALMDTINDASLLDNDDNSITTGFAEVALKRKFVLDRLTSFLRVIPPKPIRVCLDIVQETWRRIDEGKRDVYWLDVVIEKGWETIMA